MDRWMINFRCRLAEGYPFFSALSLWPVERMASVPALGRRSIFRGAHLDDAPGRNLLTSIVTLRLKSFQQAYFFIESMGVH